jgi:hypothetical protein
MILYLLGMECKSSILCLLVLKFPMTNLQSPALMVRLTAQSPTVLGLKPVKTLCHC